MEILALVQDLFVTMYTTEVAGWPSHEAGVEPDESAFRVLGVDPTFCHVCPPYRETIQKPKEQALIT